MLKKLSGECACGELATKRNSNKEFVCDRCRDLQTRGKEINGHYANYGRRSQCTEEPEETEEQPPSISQDAINRLDRMMKAVDKAHAAGVEPTPDALLAEFASIN